MDARDTSRSKSAEVGTSTGVVGVVSSRLHFPQRTDSPSLSYASRFFCPHDGHVTSTPRSSVSKVAIAPFRTTYRGVLYPPILSPSNATVSAYAWAQLYSRNVS